MNSITIFIDISINRLLCLNCNKLISIKHISEHLYTIHQNYEFSLKNFTKINKILVEYRKLNKLEELLFNNDVDVPNKLTDINLSSKT